MGSSKTYRKVAFDMSVLQLAWSFWIIGIGLIVYVALLLFGADVQGGNKLGQLLLKIMGKDVESGETGLGRGFSAFILHPSKIFMLICGISSVSAFLTYFVRHGVTRKAYFYGAAISSAVVSLGIALMAGVIFWVEQMVFSPDIRLDVPWIVVVILHALNILVYYVAGWLISAGFYRYGWGGVLFILLAVALAFTTEVMWETELQEGLNVPEAAVPFLATLLLPGAALWIVRMTTKRVRVRLE